ncbi:conserved exported protein of unknown function [Petrocella atlantisensis]|uniref:Uncharacterized protein n=1 Tax=Petrocella atlantisensis TaxID=2173034 RepID=A0A3P7PYH3_9FIRM|nr:hypothetical protein [Petrocella atlantisensis]VDN48667.1 conserved exported protein of unknown function [Petrocella atlantisensis]
MKTSKKILWTLMLISLLTLTACNNSATQISEIKSELESVKAENSQLENELVVMEEEIVSLEETITAMEDDISATELEATSSSSGPSSSVVNTSADVIEAMNNQDFATLSTFIHPTQGVRFTPYTYVDTVNDVVFTSAQVANMAVDPTLILWGAYDGTGEPIQMTALDYFDAFVYDEDYMNPQIMGFNTTVHFGNMIENLETVYPNGDYIEYHFNGFDPIYEGLDWSSLTLVYEEVGSVWYLVGIINHQWTT